MTTPATHLQLWMTTAPPALAPILVATLHRSTRWAGSDLVAWARAGRRAGYRHPYIVEVPCTCGPAYPGRPPQPIEPCSECGRLDSHARRCPLYQSPDGLPHY